MRGISEPLAVLSLVKPSWTWPTSPRVSAGLHRRLVGAGPGFPPIAWHCTLKWARCSIVAVRIEVPQISHILLKSTVFRKPKLTPSSDIDETKANLFTVSSYCVVYKATVLYKLRLIKYQFYVFIFSINILTSKAIEYILHICIYVCKTCDVKLKYWSYIRDISYMNCFEPRFITVFLACYLNHFSEGNNFFYWLRCCRHSTRA